MAVYNPSCVVASQGCHPNGLLIWSNGSVATVTVVVGQGIGAVGVGYYASTVFRRQIAVVRKQSGDKKMRQR